MPFVQKWAFRPVPPDVGLAVQRVKGKDRLVIELQTHTTARGKLELNVEAFINSAASTEGKCHPHHQKIALSHS